MSMTSASNGVILERVSYIHYPVKFRKSKETIQALIDLGNEVIVRNSAYVAVLGLKVCPTIIGA